MLLRVNAVRLVILVAATAAGSGCAAWNRTRPHDMTVARHEEASRRHRVEAESRREWAALVGRGAEWDRAEVRHHARLAADHARAAKELDAEVRAACPWGTARLPAPLESLGVVKVDAIREADGPVSGRGRYPRLQGARLVVAGGGPAELGQAARCVKLQAIAGTADREALESPFAVPGARFAVNEDREALALEIRGTDAASAAEILGRAQAFATRSGASR